MEDRMGYKNESVMDSGYFYAPLGPVAEPTLTEMLGRFKDVSAEDLEPLVRHLMCVGMSVTALEECSEEVREEFQLHDPNVIAAATAGACLELFLRNNPCPQGGRHTVTEESPVCDKCQTDIEPLMVGALTSHAVSLANQVVEAVTDLADESVIDDLN
jgi:hypothetical protein